MTPRLVPVLVLLLWSSTSQSLGGNAEIRGKITNSFTADAYRAITIVITDRLGVEIGRTKPDKKGRYQIKISGPRYIIVKAMLEGYATQLYQLDTEEYRESTDEREENRVFGQMRIPTYYQDITLHESEASDRDSDTLPTLDELTGEDPRVARDYRKAQQRKQSGDLPGAVRELEKLIRKSPDFYLGYMELGLILLAQQENDRAFDVFARARAIRPGQSWAYVGLGMALNNKENYSGASGFLEKAVELEPNSIHAQFQLGQALFQLNDHDRALVCLRRVNELNPRFHPLTYKTLASIYVNRQDAGEAVKALENYLAFFPDAEDLEKVKEILERLKPSQ